MFLISAFVFLGIILLVIQTTLFPLFPNWFGRPDLVFVLLMFVAYRFSWLTGLFLAFALGWIMDVVSGLFLGTYPLMTLIIFCTVKTLTQESPVKETVYQIPLVGVSYFVFQCGFYLFFMFMQPDILPPWSWGRVVRETFIVLVAAIPCFVLFNGIYEKLLKRSFVTKRMKRRSGNRFR